MIGHVREVGPHFGERLEALAARHAIVRSVRGAGVMRGLELTIDAQPVVQFALDHGLLVNGPPSASSACCRRSR